MGGGVKIPNKKDMKKEEEQIVNRESNSVDNYQVNIIKRKWIENSKSLEINENNPYGDEKEERRIWGLLRKERKTFLPKKRIEEIWRKKENQIRRRITIQKEKEI